MDLTFNKDGGSFVAEFVTTADFNLHIEKSGGDFRIMQKTPRTGKYDSIDGLYIPAGNPVIDYDFVASIYPKYIKIVSEVEPTLAVVTSAGEVTEIKPVPKNTFSIQVYVEKDGMPTPSGEPAVFEYSGDNVTWEAFVSENSDDFYIHTSEIPGDTRSFPIWRDSGENIGLMKSFESGAVELITDVIIPNHEYIGINIQSL